MPPKPDDAGQGAAADSRMRLGATAPRTRAEYEAQTRAVEVLDLRSRPPPLESPDGVSRREVGHRLQQARLRCGLRTQQDAARKLGIRNSTYAAHENGNRQLRIDMARFYAERFNVSVAWLCDGVGEMERGAGSAPESSATVQSSVVVQSSAASSARQRSPEPAVDETGGSADPLEPFGARCGPDWSIGAACPGEPTELPSARSTHGFTLEVVAAAGDAAVRGESPCLVSISAREGEKLFAGEGFVRIPPDMIVGRTRLLCVKLDANPLFPHMAGQRVIVDADDIGFDFPGVFIMTVDRSQRLIPVLVRPSAKRDGNLEVVHSASRLVPMREDEARARIVGRFVIVIRYFSEMDVDALDAELRRSGG